ncbi:hypothetical protein [Sulfuricurvum sp.]|uniref:hypothetical protein n=1 Tax=Sulfuricurvum sp. TaxID=2025608 RepID=UPI002614F0CE|nr:hypothetical protein [Sulfuricurvum sp.]MDD3598363.1 hypothetical protein [Sulfuricurvum sp.]
MLYTKIVLFLVSFFLFAGCAHYDVKKEFIKNDIRRSDPNKGFVLFSDFDIPQPVKRSFKVNTATWTANPDSVEIYDVTQELKYIGHFWVNPPVYNISNSFIEQPLSIGKHTFMLIFKTRFWGMPVDSYSDFIEVNVTKENMTHIAISYYPYKKTLLGDWMLQPKFTQVLMEDKDFEFCSETISDKELREQNVTQYMERANINVKQKYFQSYCQLLASDKKRIFLLNEKSNEDFAQEKSEVEVIYKRDYSVWQNSLNKNRVFPLIQPEWVLKQKN